VSNGALFAVGLAITALVVFAIGGLLYAAMLDQRYHDEMSAGSSDDEAQPGSS
jgi:hypothetical protein